jgi:hypothetical protein
MDKACLARYNARYNKAGSVNAICAVYNNERLANNAWEIRAACRPNAGYRTTANYHMLK